MAFDELRLLRNQSEYDALAVSTDDVRDALEHARALVDVIGEALDS